METIICSITHIHKVYIKRECALHLTTAHLDKKAKTLLNLSALYRETNQIAGRLVKVYWIKGHFFMWDIETNELYLNAIYRDKSFQANTIYYTLQMYQAYNKYTASFSLVCIGN